MPMGRPGNLRVYMPAQNQRSRAKRSGTASKSKGVGQTSTKNRDSKP